ncbi:MOSC domain-containing protein [Aeromicrobium wangtongii]|uniref:MOSC domain-containing protein n=1 Tax=Aeromicrobium wangtongii TaxID=2969247 RepID=UPI00201776C2|nr:MOSC domain-containing protein [Aeromicrobium wangtongii]MCL3817097.1 molybdenum cofactor biosysynthesis protein [Aeromicrobium wangtongii]
MEFELVSLVVSPVRRMDGRPRDGMTPYDGDETPSTVRVRAHKGLVGDRYFNTRFTYASVTMIAAEKIEQLETQIAGEGLFPATNTPFDPVLARRNLVTRGLDVDALVRHTFTLDAGHGPIRFRSITPANPCAWLNVVYADGAHQALRGHAGIRCEPLDDGQLSVGPATVTDIAPIPQDELTRQVRRAPVA